ncbi:MAG: T9SS type A sorting domain-containing protein [Bacteroidota bacterium]|nr:T9SS type A sorting domain-containing protein [Bacteroidota bacterium]
MPQTYWAARPTTPSNELSLMSSQFTSYTNLWVSQGDSAANKPIMPIGQGEYFGYSNDVQQGDVASFCNLSDTLYHYPGVSLWEYNQITHQYVWDEYTAAWQSATSVGRNNTLVKRFELMQNYPNPFNPTTHLRYTIADFQFVTLKIYDVLGREVATLVDERKSPGMYEVNFDGSRLSSGVYFYRLTSGNFVQTKKFVLMK